MSTTAEATTEHDQKAHQIRCDRREHPGDGIGTQCKHLVRIVVLRDDALTAARSRVSNESHGLTKEELRIGQDLLEKMDAPSPAERMSEPPKKMFEVLKPTDIVVIGQEAASVRVAEEQDHAGDARKPPTLELTAHNDRNKDTVLKIWTDSDTVEYQCDEEFKIVEVKQAGWNIYNAPTDPFQKPDQKAPYLASEVTSATIDAFGNLKSVWKWTSGVVPASANNQQYKMTFEIGGKRVDPDVVCGNPPPG